MLDGELIALGEDDCPDFAAVCERLLNGNRSIPPIYIVFDVLEHERRSTMHLPFPERRQMLDWLRLNGPDGQTSAVFEGEACSRSHRSAASRGSSRSASATLIALVSAAG